MGDRSYGLDPNYVARVADEVKSVMELGAQVCLVVGGGNIFRGVSGALRVWSGRPATRWVCWRR